MASCPQASTLDSDTFAVVDRFAHRANSEPTVDFSAPQLRPFTRASLERSLNLPMATKAPAATAVAWAPKLNPFEERRLSAFAGEPTLSRADVLQPSADISAADVDAARDAREVALHALAMQAEAWSHVLDINAATGTLTFAADTLGAPPWHMDFDLRHVDTEGADATAFLGLRIWTRGIPGAAHAHMVTLAPKCFSAALEGTSCEVFSADYTAYLSLADMLSVFGEAGYNYDWAQAKITARTDTHKSPPIERIEACISEQTGKTFAFAADAVGRAKMWVLNALREKYFYEPVLRLAADAVTQVLVEAWATEDAPGNTFVIVQQRWHGPHTYACEAQELAPDGAAVGSPIRFGVDYRSVGSRECDSDIDCTVVLKPDPYLFALFARVVDGTDEAPGVLAQALETLAVTAPELRSRSAARVFDINFYPPGFLRDAEAGLLASPFHTTTHDASLIKMELDRGASITHLLTAAPRLLRGLVGANESLDGMASPAALDYALYRVLGNSCREASFILNLGRHLPKEPGHEALFEALQKALDPVVAPEPLRRLGKGAMTSAQRLHALNEVVAIREAIREISARDITRAGVPIVEIAKHAVTAEYAQSLANVTHRRDLLLSDAIAQQAQEVDPLTRVDHVDMRDALDALALHAIDLQVALGSEAPEAYASAAAVRRTVEGQQQHIAQNEDPFIAAIAATEDAGFVAAHATDDFLSGAGVTVATATPTQRRRAFAQYLLAVAKYVDRIVNAARAVDASYWDKDSMQLGAAKLTALAQQLRAAKARKSESDVLLAATLAGFDSDDAIRAVCFKLALYAQRRGRLLGELERGAVIGYQRVIAELDASQQKSPLF